MKHKRALPIPFIILILAGAISLGSVLASRISGASAAPKSSLQIQTVEQERMVAMYFRVLSWLSDVAEHESAPRQTAAQQASVPHVADTPQSAWRPVEISLCVIRSARDFAAGRIRAHLLN
jgi:hypothetical protein